MVLRFQTLFSIFLYEYLHVLHLPVGNQGYNSRILLRASSLGIRLFFGAQALPAGSGFPVKFFEEGAALVGSGLEVLLELAGGEGTRLDEVVLRVY
jgi:hypothetical protein